jgi:drug/metabolite transporter (DMT)-like permease
LAVILFGVVLSAASDDGAGAPGGDGIAVGPDPAMRRATPGDPVGSPDGRHDHVARVAALSIGAAILFGLNLYALARAGDQTSVVWGLWPARLVGTFAVALPLAARRQLPLPGRAWPYVVGSGLAEVTGILAYAAGARHGVAVPAVVGSQFAGLAALGGYLLLGERISRRQVAGLVTIAFGVAALAALQAS